MISRPGYYINDPGALITFPRAPRPGSGLARWIETNLEHETEEGVLWVYPQIRRRIWRPTFRVNVADFAIFEALHLAVNGREATFYYVPDVAVLANAYLVRKEKGLEYTELDQLGLYDGVEQEVIDYSPEFTEEISASSVTA